MSVTAANKESICAENNVILVELRQLSYFLPVARILALVTTMVTKVDRGN